MTEPTTTASFWQRARTEPDRAVLIDPDDRVWTAGELLQRCDALAATMQMLGLERADSVAVVAPNHVDTLCVALAVTQIGGYFVPISDRSTAAEIEYVVENCSARFLFAEAGALERCHDATTSLPEGHIVRIGADTSSEVGVHIDEFGATGFDGAELVRWCGQIMPYTSGTTGRPKGVRRPLPDADPDEYWATSSRSSFEVLRLAHDDADVHLVASPLYHTAIINLATSALHVGQQVVVRRRFEPLDVLATIERHRVTNAHMVPTQFHRLLSVDPQARARFDLGSLRTLLHGAAPCPLGVKRGMIEWLGPVVCEYYGASEGGGTFVDSEEWLAHPGTVGRPYPGAEIHILDDDGEPVPAGTVGRVFIRPLGGLFEYHGDPDKTASSRSNGLITAGDVGHLDPDGYLFLRGRGGDLVITGGVNVYPAEVEDALFGHPGVADAVVIGLPDEEWGEVVTAVVELRPGWPVDASTEESIREHCAERLARYKLPKRIEFVETLPREPNGKIRRPQLIARYRETDPAGA